MLTGAFRHRINRVNLRVHSAAVVALLITVARPAFAGPTSCQPSEEQIFACSTGAKKVAICASAGWSANSGSMQYRFGTDKIAELVLPASKVRPSASALAGTLMFSGGGGAYLRFRAGDFEYAVYSAFSSQWGEKRGVVVTKSDKVIRSLKCKGPSSSKLGSDLFTKARFSTDDRDLDLPD